MAFLYEPGTTKVIGETKTWLQKHERLILGLLLLLVFLKLGNSALDYSANKASRQDAAAQQALALSKQNADRLTAMSEQQQAEFLAVTKALEAQNQTLKAAIAAKQAATQKQQEADKTLPPNQLAQRWEALANLQPNDVRPTTDGEFSVTQPAAVVTVVQLEELPSLRAQLTDTQAVVQNKDKELNEASATVNALQSQVGGLNGQLAAKDKACTAQVNDLKKQARRSKRNWFLRGAAVGGAIVGYLAIHFM